MRGIKCANALKSSRYRNLIGSRKPPQVASRITFDNAAARIDQWPITVAEHVEERGALFFRHSGAVECLHTLAIAPELQQPFAFEKALPILDVFWNIENDRTRPITARNIKRRSNGSLEFFRIEHQEGTLGARAHDVEDRGFLKGIGADGGPWNLSANQDNGNRIGHAIANGRDAIGRPRTRCHHRNANLPARPCVSGGHEAGALLVRGDDEFDRLAAFGFLLDVIAAQRVPRRQDGAPAIAKQNLDALVRQHLNNHVRARHHLIGEGMLA